MSIESWETHLEQRGEPALAGNWGEVPWEFYESSEEVPLSLPVRTGMVVPVCSLDAQSPQVMLTLNVKRGGYEIPGGHLDPLPDGGLEPAAVAAARELTEETGLSVPGTRQLMPYGYIEARNDAVPVAPNGKQYPPRTYMQFFGAHTPDRPGAITDPEVDGAGIFSYDALRRMSEHGAMKVSEFFLVTSGIRAVLRSHGIPDDRLGMR